MFFNIRRSFILWLRKIYKVEEGCYSPLWIRIITNFLFPLWWLRQDKWYDIQNDVFTIFGIKYSGRLFRYLSNNKLLPLGSTFKIINRNNGVITIIKQDTK